MRKSQAIAAASRDSQRRLGLNDDVELVRVGNCILGHIQPRPRRPFSALQGRASRRLKALGALGALRAADGVLLNSPRGWLQVVVDALGKLHGYSVWRLSESHVRKYLPPHEFVSSTAIAAEIARPWPDGRLISDHDAGGLVEFCNDERIALEAGDVIVTIHPIDESASERSERRKSRKRKKNAERQARFRQAKKSRSNGVTRTAAILQFKGPATLQKCVTLPVRNTGRDTTAPLQRSKESERVMAALGSGAESPVAIGAATGLPLTTVRPILSRLVKAGLLQLVSRGRYTIVAESAVQSAKLRSVPEAPTRVAEAQSVSPKLSVSGCAGADRISAESLKILQGKLEIFSAADRLYMPTWTVLNTALREMPLSERDSVLEFLTGAFKEIHAARGGQWPGTPPEAAFMRPRER